LKPLGILGKIWLFIKGLVLYVYHPISYEEEPPVWLCKDCNDDWGPTKWLSEREATHLHRKKHPDCQGTLERLGDSNIYWPGGNIP